MLTAMNDRAYPDYKHFQLLTLKFDFAISWKHIYKNCRGETIPFYSGDPLAFEPLSRALGIEL